MCPSMVMAVGAGGVSDYILGIVVFKHREGVNF